MVKFLLKWLVSLGDICSRNFPTSYLHILIYTQLLHFETIKLPDGQKVAVRLSSQMKRLTSSMKKLLGLYNHVGDGQPGCLPATLSFDEIVKPDHNIYLLLESSKWVICSYYIILQCYRKLLFYNTLNTAYFVPHHATVP